jgi:lipopolysaccharide transport system ATP-binding protein
MSEIAIRVEKLSKKYKIEAKKVRHDTLRDQIMHGIKGFFRGKEKISPEKNTIWALRDVYFEAKHGEVIGIIGRNGAGKSTLLKILSRITEPTSGRAMLYGRVGSLVEVGTGFDAELTGRENIYLSGAILGMRKREIDRKLEEIIAFSGVERFIDTPVKRYSSGMYVRLGFAVAAHLEPEILLIDEVLAVGDADFQKKCLNKMQDVGKQGRTVIFISHDMSAITRLCERTILLDEGRVVSDGPTHQVVGNYLKSSLGITAVREWSDPTKAPGNEIVRMLSVRVRTEDGQVKDTVDIRQLVGVEIEYEVFKPGHILVAYSAFVNEENICAFVVIDRDPAWQRRPRPAGRFVSTAWIPGNLLAEGMLIVRAGIITEVPFSIHCDVPEAVAFQVIDSMDGDTARGDFGQKFWGVVRPLLKWTTHFTPK